MIELGTEVRDKVSGFQGITVARHTYLNGCDRYSVQPKVDKDGKLPDAQGFDEMQLELVNAQVVAQGPKETGGPDKYPDTKQPMR